MVHCLMELCSSNILCLFSEEIARQRPLLGDCVLYESIMRPALYREGLSWQGSR